MGKWSTLCLVFAFVWLVLAIGGSKSGVVMSGVWTVGYVVCLCIEQGRDR